MLYSNTNTYIEPFRPNNPSANMYLYVLYFKTHLLNTCLYTCSLYTRNLHICTEQPFQPSKHKRAHWYTSILMQYFISELQQHCAVKGCDPSRSVCLGRRIPAKLVKVRIDYCSALSYLIFRFLPRLVSPLGPGWTKFTDDEDCCGNKMKCLPWNTGVKPDRSRSPILPEPLRCLFPSTHVDYIEEDEADD